MAEKRTTYKIQDLGGIGEVQIADEVVAIIAGLAATEVDGVASMAGNITNELVSKLGMKNLSKGVKVTVLEGVVTVDLNLNIEYGKNILETSKKVQEFTILKIQLFIYNLLTVFRWWNRFEIKLSGLSRNISARWNAMDELLRLIIRNCSIQSD